MSRKKKSSTRSFPASSSRPVLDYDHDDSGGDDVVAPLVPLKQPSRSSSRAFDRHGRSQKNRHEYREYRDSHDSAASSDLDQLLQPEDSPSLASSTLTPPSVFANGEDEEDGGKDARRFGYGGFRRNAARMGSAPSNSALTMRSGGQWMMSPSFRKGDGHGGPLDSSGTGVAYRSADSTQRALDELKKKRMEAQEKRRAVTILCGLILLALSVHYAGRSGWDAPPTDALDGSRDKLYSGAKDLGYGDQRVAMQVGSDQTNDNAQNSDNNSDNDNNNADQDYYGDNNLPPPQEKIYDDEHLYMVPLMYYADVKDLHRRSDTPFFFHVPRAGGSTVKDLIGKCLKLVQSSEVGVRDGHGQDPVLQVISIQESQYVNVDTTTTTGIQRAVDLGLAPSGFADVIISSYFHNAASLFDLHHQGRAFIMLRNPIDRAVSMYYHRINEVRDLEKSITIEQYAHGNGIENNWMTRFLTNRMEGELTKEDLEQAKYVLETKFLIGFIDDAEETFYRFMKYNQWTFAEDETEKMKQEDCIRDLASVGSNINPTSYEIPKRGTQAYALISWQTQFDNKLFEYARELFDHQTKLWGTKERKKLLKKKKKGGK